MKSLNLLPRQKAELGWIIFTHKNFGAAVYETIIAKNIFARLPCLAKKSKISLLRPSHLLF